MTSTNMQTDFVIDMGKKTDVESSFTSSGLFGIARTCATIYAWTTMAFSVFARSLRSFDITTILPDHCFTAGKSNGK